MNIIETKINGLKILEPKLFADERGSFLKIFNKELFLANFFETDFQESYYSVSKKNVIRGMHFQSPPKDHAKLVYVTSGSITDVVLDIRKSSTTYGQFIQFDISALNGLAVYIPRGCAHGFLSLEDDTCVTYMQTSTYSKENDSGIRVDSFGHDWGVDNPIMSLRDKEFPSFNEFGSPFE